MNRECGHMFCGICVMQVWVKHIEKTDVMGMAAWEAYLCVTCHREMMALLGKGLRTWENMPFQVDGVTEWLLLSMCERGRVLCREIKGLKMGMEGEDEGDEWEEMDRRWVEGGDMLHERAYGQQASVDMMAWFEDYWLNWESREMIRSTELFQGINEKDGQKIPKSPKR